MYQQTSLILTTYYMSQSSHPLPQPNSEPEQRNKTQMHTLPFQTPTLNTNDRTTNNPLAMYRSRTALRLLPYLFADSHQISTICWLSGSCLNKKLDHPTDGRS